MNVWDKAWSLYHAGKVKEDGPNGYYLVEGETETHGISIGTSKMRCTCQHGAFQGPKGDLCSHIIAAIIFRIKGMAEKAGVKL